MAKKKLTTGELKFDSKLDFDFNELEDFDVGEAKTGKNKPVLNFGKGMLGAAKSKIKDPSFLASIARKSLPDQYGEVADAVAKDFGDISSLYDQEIRAIKPKINQLTRKVNKLIPENQKLLKKMANKIEEMTNVSTSFGQSKEAMQDESISRSLSEVFAIQQEQRQADRKDEINKEILQQNIENKRFNATHGLLASIDNSLVRVATYTEKVNQAFQKKSLELQYRSYFIQSETLAKIDRYFEIFNLQNQALIKNTGLPDFAKLKTSDALIQSLRKKGFDNLFSGKGIIATGLGRIKQDMVNTIRKIGDLASSGVDVLDQMESVKDINEATGTDSKEFAGGFVGDFLLDMLGGYAADKIKDKIPKNGRISRKGYQLLSMYKNADAYIKKAKNSKFIKENYGETSVKGFMAGLSDSFLNYFQPERVSTLAREGNKISDLNNVPGFNNKTQIAITEIIPGFLARILREQMRLRTGSSDIDLVQYNFKKNSFSEKAELTKEVNEAIDRKTNSGMLKYRTDKSLDHIERLTGNSLDGQIKGKIANFFIELSKTDSFKDAEGVKKTSLYKSLDQNTKDTVDTYLNKIETADNPEAEKFKFSSNLSSIKNELPGIINEVNSLIDAGYQDILKDQGIIKVDSDGNVRVDIDSYNSKISNFISSSYIKSDINVKQGIKKFNPKDALRGIRNTKLYSWAYKDKMNDKDRRVPGARRHLGPMAQDVKQNLGNATAPDGTSIDLINMNGALTGSVQALAEQQDRLMKSDKTITLLDQIRINTATISEQLKHGFTFGIPIYGINIDRLKNAFFKAKDKLGTAKDAGIEYGKKGYAKSKLFGGKIAEKAELFYDKNKDKFAEFAKESFTKLIEFTETVYGKTKDFLVNSLPKGMRWAVGKLKDFGKAAIDFFSEVKDMYVPGNPIPVLRAELIKAGHYIDEATGKVIQSVDNITGQVRDRYGNIVLTKEELNKGLFDIDGKSIKTRFLKLYNFAKDNLAVGVKRLSKYAVHGFNLIKDKTKGFAEKLKSLINLPTITIGLGEDERIYKVLTDIRGILATSNNIDPGSFNDAIVPNREQTLSISQDGVTTPGDNKERSKTNYSNVFNNIINKDKVKNRIDDLRNKASSKIDKAKNIYKQIKDSDKNVSTKDLFSKLKNKFTKSKNEDIQHSEDHAFNDRDGSGKRDGSADDRIEAMREADKNKPKHNTPVEVKSRYGGNGDLLGGILGKVGNLFSMLTSGVGGIFNFATKMLGGLGSIGGMLGKVAGGAANVLGKTGGIIGKGIGLARTIGTPIASAINFATKIPGIGMAANAFNVVRTGMLGAGLVTGGAASAVTSILGLGMSAVSAVLASPVILGTAAVGLAGYGLYKLYKRQSKKDAFFDIRLKQYGLTGLDDSNAGIILDLEQELVDKVGFAGGKAYLVEKQLDPVALLKIFSIDRDDSEMVSRFMKWFNGRFKPFFLTHVTSANALSPKATIFDVDKFTADLKVKYLDSVSYDSGPYSEDTSPFKDTVILPINESLAAKNAIDKLRSSLADEAKKAEADKANKQAEKDRQDINKKAEADRKASINKDLSQIQSGNNAGKNITNVIDNQTKKEANKPIPGLGEGEGQAPTATVNSSSSSKTNGNLKAAGGPLADPSSGSQYMKVGNGVDLSGVNQELLKNFKAMVAEYGTVTGKSVIVTSGARSTEEQAALYRKDPSKAAKPGNSLHEFGLALDVDSKALNDMERLGLMRKYGFTRPVGGEPWHTEPAGIQGSIQKAKADPNFATAAIDNSLYKGGGGAALDPNTPKSMRNDALALANANSNSGTASSSNSGLMKASFTNSNSISAASSNDSKFDNFSDIEKPNAVGIDVVKSNKPIDTRNKEDVKTAIDQAAKTAGVDSNHMKVIAQLESSLNPNAKASTGTASGAFGFTNATWQESLAKHGSKYGLSKDANPNDITASTLMASEYYKKNAKALSGVKDNPTITDIYLAHLLGTNGAKIFLTANPNALGVHVLPEAAKNNRDLFFNGTRPLTIGEIYNLIDSKVNKAASAVGVNLGQNTPSNSVNKPTMPADNVVGMNGTPYQGISEPKQQSKPAPVKLSETPSSATMASKPTVAQPSADNFGISKLLGNTNDILAASLKTHQESYELLKGILANTNPERIASLLLQDRQQSPDTIYNSVKKVSDPPFNLSRRSA